MREILFRGKTLEYENGNIKREWVYGSYYKDDIGDCIKELPSAVSTPTHFIDIETLGQYTGLKDKNGKRIFEGDILKIVDDEGNTDFSDGGVGNVEFAYGLWYVSGKPQNGLWDLLQAYYCEVIGNIHDNPELLGGE